MPHQPVSRQAGRDCAADRLNRGQRRLRPVDDGLKDGCCSAGRDRRCRRSMRQVGYRTGALLINQTEVPTFRCIREILVVVSSQIRFRMVVLIG